ncbi:maestro heat-like repeat-containing protein family member 6 [Myiozetetes cayanensis]|uniref:maestro heat-like repeat-containing protein family member 6 n=1 Tax=Myiozetetes cayanensis TaxID=478635 RepID=UPI00215E9D87|nr:maestro heat-like repeat-containing protein family member 6 [Myiozetetes cayanensis]
MLPACTLVPAFVRNLHQTLTANVLPEDGLLRDLWRVTDEHPADVALTLLHCAPSCDRAAAVMWRTITSSGRTVEKVLPVLLRVMEEWPLYCTFTSDGDHKHIYGLAAIRVVWEILQRLQCPEPLKENSPRLLVALLFNVFISTEPMPEKIDTFWRQCWQEQGLARNPKRFAVHVIKALLFHLECEDVVMAMDRKAAWDTLFHMDTHHYAVGLLAREMRRVSSPLCRHMGCYLLQLLSQAAVLALRWELPAMAFFVEVLDCLDMRECGDRVLQILARPLQSKCPERNRLALRMLLVLRKDPSMADSTLSLTPSLVQLLGDADGELVAMILAVLWDHLREPDIQLSRPTALKLAEALQPLLGNDISQVQLLSIHVFHKVMELAANSARKTLKRYVVQSLLPLFLHCHNDNRHVAKVSRQALLCAARFLKWSDLENLVMTETLCTFGKCLLQKDKRRAAKYLRQALPYLQSPQEPVREAALGFMGIAGRYLRGQHKELLLVIQGE